MLLKASMRFHASSSPVGVDSDMNKSHNIGTLFAASAAILFAIGGLVAAIANPPSPQSPQSPQSPPSHQSQSAPAKSTAPKPPAFTISGNPAGTGNAAGAKTKSGSTKPDQTQKPESTHKSQRADKVESTAPQHGAAPVNANPQAAKVASTVTQSTTSEPSHAVSNAEEALALLIQGNARWVEGKVISPNTQAQRREDLAANGQNPFVTIVTCSDSRIPVERVFDRGVGDLFVIRVAGNRAASSEVGTVEYGVEHLKTPLLVVMGHSKCGAVAAAVSGAHLHGKVAELVAGIQPAVDRARKHNPSADEATLIAVSIKENVWQTIFDLYKSSPEVRAMAANGSLKVVGAHYDIASGKVEILGEHPWQLELFSAMATPITQPTGHSITQNADKPAHATHPVSVAPSKTPTQEDVHATAPSGDHK